VWITVTVRVPKFTTTPTNGSFTFLKSSQCRCNNFCFAKSPKTVEVKDAGNLIANGVFERITTDQGSDHAVAHAIEYKKRGDTINGSSAIVSITLSKLTQGSYWSIRWKPHSYSSETHYLYETSIKVFWDLFFTQRRLVHLSKWRRNRTASHIGL
jgi:hypothetical protein